MTNLQDQALAYLKDEMSAEEKAAFEAALASSEAYLAEVEAGRELLDLLEAANEESTVKKVHAQIQQALKEGAEALHMANEAGVALVTFRIDGVLHEALRYEATGGQETCEASSGQRRQYQALVDRWKVMAEMNVAERRVPQDGRIAVRFEGQDYDLWVNVLPTITGERVTVRIHCRSRRLIGLDRLGLQPAHRAACERLIRRPYGLILVAGLAGSGKTTLMHSMLTAIQERDTPRKNILTVEDGIGYALSGVSQTAVNHAAGMTYVAVLRSFLRADPDVVMLGELRDLESAKVSFELALTRCLLMTQVHVPSAVSVLQRLQDIGLPRFMIAHVLAGVIGLRLVRRVCPECSVAYIPAAEALRKAGLSLAEDGPFRRGRGCAACHQTGYQGRIGLFEVLEVSQDVRQQLADNITEAMLWKQTLGRVGGSLWDDAREKVRQGLTTLEEVNAALFDYPHPSTPMDALQAVRYEIDGQKIV